MTFKKQIIPILLFSLFSYLTVNTALAVNFSILKNDRNVAVTYGDQLPYDFEYSNWEHRVIKSVVFEDTIPNGTTFTVVDPWVCDGYVSGDIAVAGTICTLDYGDIAEGDINKVIEAAIVVQINDTFEYDHVTNTVRVLENGTEEIATSTVETPIREPEVYSLVKSDNEHFLCTDEIELGIFVDNVGLVHVKDLSLELIMPENIKMLSTEWDCIDNICTLDYGDLAADTEVELLFNVEVIDQDLCEDGPITFDLNLTSGNKYEEAAYRTIYLDKLEPGLKVTKTLRDIVTIEEDEEYRATIKLDIENIGEIDLTEINLDEDLEGQLGLFDSFKFVKAWSDDCNLNSNYNGDGDIRLVEDTSLLVGEKCTLYYEVLLRDDADEEYDVTSKTTGNANGDQLDVDVNLYFELKFDNDDAIIQAEQAKSNNNNSSDDSGSQNNTTVNSSSTTSSSSTSGGGRVLGARSDSVILANTGSNLISLYMVAIILLFSTSSVIMKGSKI